MSHQVQRPGAQLSKDTGLASNTAGVFAHGDIAHVVQGVFDQPMVANGVRCGTGGQFAGADIPCDLAAWLPLLERRVEDLGVAANPNQTADAGPLLGHTVGGQRPHRGGSGFDAVSLPDLIFVMAIAGRSLLRQRHHRFQQRGLVAFELNQHVVAAGDGDLQRFFGNAAHPA